MSTAPAEPRAAGGDTLNVEVVYCPAPGRVDRTPLVLPAGATLRDALAASGVLARHGLAEAELTAGIWGRVQPLDAPLRERDRVELYRALLVDPKEARRQRYRSAAQRKAGTKGAGLSGSPTR